MVNIVTDSTADLSEELVQRFGIKVVPLWVHISGQSYQDGVDIDRNLLFSLVEKCGELPKTAAATIPEFTEVFQTAEESLYVGISSKFSSSVPNAILANEALQPDHKAFVVDSLNLSTGIGLLAVKAAELRDKGLSAQAIQEELKTWVPRVRTSFVIDTLDYLYMGGRCSAMENVVGSLLKIRPVIYVKPDGTMGVKEKIRGSRKKSLDSMLEDFKKRLPQIDLQRVFITHTGCDADAVYLAEELKKMADIQEICITYAGCVIASHCGPNTIGILFFAND
ncbi:MAG: DegV family protein [Anaerolineaceae bacterium]